MALTRDEILARKVGRAEITLPDGSGTVKIRALTRNEALEVHDYTLLADKDNHVISCGLVEPAMTMDDVAAWAAADDAGTVNFVSERIAELSGMKPDSGKAATKSVRRR